MTCIPIYCIVVKCLCLVCTQHQSNLNSTLKGLFVILLGTIKKKQINSSAVCIQHKNSNNVQVNGLLNGAPLYPNNVHGLNVLF